MLNIEAGQETYYETYQRTCTEFAQIYQAHFPESELAIRNFCAKIDNPETSENQLLAPMKITKIPVSILQIALAGVSTYISPEVWDRELLIRMGVIKNEGIHGKRPELKALFDILKEVKINPETNLASYIFAIRALAHAQELSLDKINLQLNQLKAPIKITGRNHEVFLSEIIQPTIKYHYIANRLAFNIARVEPALGVLPEELALWKSFALLHMSGNTISGGSGLVRKPILISIRKGDYQQASQSLEVLNHVVLNPTRVFQVKQHIQSFVSQNSQ